MFVLDLLPSPGSSIRTAKTRIEILLGYDPYIGLTTGKYIVLTSMFEVFESIYLLVNSAAIGLERGRD